MRARKVEVLAKEVREVNWRDSDGSVYLSVWGWKADRTRENAPETKTGVIEAWPHEGAGCWDLRVCATTAWQEPVLLTTKQLPQQ